MQTDQTQEPFWLVVLSKMLRKAIYVLVLVIAMMSLGFYWSRNAPKKYQTTAKLFLYVESNFLNSRSIAYVHDMMIFQDILDSRVSRENIDRELKPSATAAYQIFSKSDRGIFTLNVISLSPETARLATAAALKELGISAHRMGLVDSPDVVMDGVTAVPTGPRRVLKQIEPISEPSPINAANPMAIALLFGFLTVGVFAAFVALGIWFRTTGKKEWTRFSRLLNNPSV